MESTAQSMQLYEARRKWGGFMRRKIETTLPDGTTAISIGGILGREGIITVGEKTYHVARSVMSDAIQGVAEYAIGGGFMRLTNVRLNDLEQKRSFTLRQRRVWSSTLVLLEKEIQIGEFRSNCLQSPYRIVVDDGVPRKIVLLCVWVAMCRMAFTA